MQRINWKQTKAVLKALDVLYSDSEPATLPARLLGAVRTAVASETILVDGFHPPAVMNSLAQYPTGSMSPDGYALLARHLPQHPLFPSIILKGETKAMRTNEVAARTAFRKTALYNEMFRPMAIDDQIIVRVDGSHGTFITCCLSRTRREFVDEDRRVIDLLQSHLASALKGAQTIERMQSVESSLLRAFGEARLGVVVLGAGGEIKHLTDSAVSLLQKYFSSREFGGNKMPETINRWVRQFEIFRQEKDFHQPVPPLTIQGAGAELRIRLSPNKVAGECILLLEEKSLPSPASLQALGLTRREAEVLFWVAQGKTDSTIGLLCHISPRTVQIHLRHAYNKLGVENRTAATLRVLEHFQS